MSGVESHIGREVGIRHRSFHEMCQYPLWRLTETGNLYMSRAIRSRGQGTSASYNASAETAMSNPHLPAEILDHVVDVLHDTHDTLRNCCLVSESWIPRTRKHLFADVRFLLMKNVQSWEETFLDPMNSPAHYTKTLCISLSVVTSRYAEVEDWIGGFSCVERLEIMGGNWNLVNPGPVSLVPFHGFSPALKSLHVSLTALPSPQVFNLIISFPLVEDLAVIATPADPYDSVHGYDELPIATQPSSPYMFTGSLELYLSMGIVPFTCRLLSLPGGVHFRELTLRWLRKEDHSLTMALVKGCSHTLESLDVACNHLGKSIRDLCLHQSLFFFLGGSRSTPIDLSQATKLRDVVFRPISWRVEWITMTLQTITPSHQDLRQISIRVHHPSSVNISGAGVYADVRGALGEPAYREWLDLDHLLVRLWESRSVRPKAIVSTTPTKAEWGSRDCVGSLLPEATKGRMIELAEPSVYPYY
jgi:hypothetical protein